MSLETAGEFDPGEELSCFVEPGRERYGLSDRTYFYLIVTCKAIESFSESAFLVGSLFNKGAAGLTPAGCFVEFVIHQAFSINVFQRLCRFSSAYPLASQLPNVTFGGRVQLWASSADDAEARSQYLVYDATADNPESWEGLLKEIGRVEKFGVFINHADRLRLMWTQWVVERRRRDDDRGY